jgi:predicted LPLAT superfamily acyltransferase
VRTINLDDVVTVSQLIAMALTDRIFPESHRHRVDACCAHLHIALRGSKVRPIRVQAAETDLDLDLRELEKRFMASVYEDMRYTLGEYRARGWNPEIQLLGEHHITDALSQGNGVVLWVYSSTLGGLVLIKALRSAGFEVCRLSTDVHPYSGSRFGRRFLNPIRTKIENRYLAQRVTFRPRAAAVAVWRLTQLLRENKLVEIAATAASDTIGSFPFLGGTLHLALGAPMVATLGRAPLIPVFPIPVGRERFEVHVEAPLSGRPGLNPRENALQLAGQYPALLEKYVKKAPHVWRGWFSRTNWVPRGGSSDAAEGGHRKR